MFLPDIHMFIYLLGSVIPSDWPKIGEIVIDNVSLRYDFRREPVITNLDLLIPTGMKVSNLFSKKKYSFLYC